MGNCCCRVIRPEAGVGQEDSAPDAHHQEGSGAAAERRLSRRQVSIDQLHLLLTCAPVHGNCCALVARMAYEVGDLLQVHCRVQDSCE